MYSYDRAGFCHNQLVFNRFSKNSGFIEDYIDKSPE